MLLGDEALLSFTIYCICNARLNCKSSELKNRENHEHSKPLFHGDYRFLLCTFADQWSAKGIHETPSSCVSECARKPSATLGRFTSAHAKVLDKKANTDKQSGLGTK